MQGTPNDAAEPLHSLRTSVTAFARSIAALPEHVFLTKIVNWTPRDVVAHLIGWNRYTREGCDQIQAGKEPSYLSDADNDFRRVNAASVERYAEHNPQALIRELEGSFQELDTFLSGLGAQSWGADTGVRYRGRPVTIRNMIRALGRDYDRHRQRIDKWAGTRSP